MKSTRNLLKTPGQIVSGRARQSKIGACDSSASARRGVRGATSAGLWFKVVELNLFETRTEIILNTNYYE